VSKGFEIVDCNLRVGALEIDILARQGPLIVVVEVRTRGTTSFARPLASVDSVKRGRLVRAAEQVWRDRFAGDRTAERLRFDVVAVLFDAQATRVEHVAGAFTA
jgi:putative endonuclease